jgi:hypothetical protein
VWRDTSTPISVDFLSFGVLGALVSRALMSHQRRIAGLERRLKEKAQAASTPGL